MDLSQPINHNLLVEREGFAFFTDIKYKNLPYFCPHCKKQVMIFKPSNFRGKPTLNQFQNLKQLVFINLQRNLLKILLLNALMIVK